MPLGCETLAERNCFLGPEKSWIPSAQIASERPHASLTLVDSSLLSLQRDRLSGGTLYARGQRLSSVVIVVMRAYFNAG
jgi:hypothetical protein